MVHMINVIRKAGIAPVVCINRFYTDTNEEVAVVKKAAEAAGPAARNPSLAARAATAR